MKALEVVESTFASDLPQGMQALASLAQGQDGAAPFSEQAHVEVIRAVNQHEAVPASAVKAFEARVADQLVGLAVLVLEGDTWVLEAAVSPQMRGQGIGLTLITSALKALEGQPLAAWIHGGPQEQTPALEAALAIAQHLGWKASRELYKLELPLTEVSRQRILDLADQAQLPHGLELITYSPEQAHHWVELNARAFAHHPEQGRLTLKDLQVRTESAWFRPEGFFLVHVSDSTAKAESKCGSALAGYHWTKIPTDQGAEPEGEVYAIGIDPRWQGRGLGKALTLAGMAYLAQTSDEQGKALDRIVLYVDADNTAAVSLYRSLGFTPLTVDRQYRPGAPAEATPSRSS